MAPFSEEISYFDKVTRSVQRPWQIYMTRQSFTVKLSLQSKNYLLLGCIRKQSQITTDSTNKLIIGF